MNKITEKIKKIVKSNKNLTNVASGDFISNILGAIFWVYIAALLTPEEYGEISYVVSIAAFASTLSMIGAYNSIVVLTAKNVKIQATINFISSSVGIIASVIVFFSLNKIEIGFLIFAYIFTNLVIPQLIGQKQFKEYFKITVYSKILAVVSSLILFYFIGYFGIIIGLATPALLFGFKIIQTFRTVKIDFRLIKEHSRFMLSNYILNISDSVSGSLDKIIIVPILGFAILGSYQLGLQFFGILMIIPGIVYKITLPDDAQGIPNQKLKLITISVSSAIGILSFMLIPIIIPIINSAYNDSILPIQIIAISVIPGTVASMYWSKFVGREKNRVMLGGSGLYGGSLIILIILLGQNFEALGVSLGFLISHSITMVYFIVSNYFFGGKHE
jgi:O-antigen/teichoic acid export membrane protein